MEPSRVPSSEEFPKALDQERAPSNGPETAGPRPEDRSTAELVHDLTRLVPQLAREEVALAKAELTEKGKHAGIGAFSGAGLQEQIEHARDELAGTVEALAHKADVRARAGELMTDLKARAQSSAADLRVKAQVETRDRPWLVPAAASGLLTLAALLIWLGGRRQG